MTAVRAVIHFVSSIIFSVCLEDCLLKVLIVSCNLFNARLVSSSEARGTTRKSNWFTHEYNSFSDASSKFFAKFAILFQIKNIPSFHRRVERVFCIAIYFPAVWSILDNNSAAKSSLTLEPRLECFGLISRIITFRRYSPLRVENIN